MAYELAGIESNGPSPSQQPAVLREEKILDMYGNDKARYAQALLRATNTQPKTDTTNINENGSADEPQTGGASRPLSPQLAALARKEQKFRQEQQKLKADALALDAERKELAELKALKAKLAAGDYSEADKLIDYEKLTQHKLGKDPRAEELEKVRSEISALKAAQEKDINDRFDSAVNQRRVALKTLIASDSTNEFKAIRAKKADEAVVQHILDTWENDQVELSPEEAAKEVEAELRERAKSWASLIEEEKQQEAPVQKELPPLKTGMKTLTNNMAATGEIKPPLKPLHLMNEQERYQEARRRYEEKIKQGLR